jgi:basic membrane protein A and related proteins
MAGGFRGVALALALLALQAAPARAEGFLPAVIYDTGGKFDKSFNQAAYEGAERFKKETGLPYLEAEISAEGQRELVLRSLVRRGASIIFSTGSDQRAAVIKVAADAPTVKFVLVNVAPDTPLPNVSAIFFREEEGSFLAGVAAASVSKTGKLGFIGGMDIPLIRRFSCGYAQGIRSVSATDEIIINMAGTTAAAYHDPTRGAELALGQFDRGVDIVFAAAGNTGTGVLQAAEDKGKLAIGVDSNQDYLHPGHMLTSVLKRLDNAVYSSFKSAQAGDWQPGTVSLGLKEDGIGIAVDEYNRPLLSPELLKTLDETRAKIIAGTIKVHNYVDDKTCPAQ